MATDFLRQIMILWAALAVLSLSGCGNGSGTATAVTGNQLPADLSGIAATGSPFHGTVYLSDAATTPHSASAQINTDGSFSFPASSLMGFAPPYLLKAVQDSGNGDPTAPALYTIATGLGTANINPITTAALAAASGSADMGALYQLFAATTSTSNVTNASNVHVVYPTPSPRLAGIAAAFPGTLSNAVKALGPLLDPFGASGTDPLGGFYGVNGQGLDGFFDRTTFTISGGMLTVTDVTSGTNVFFGSLQDLARGTGTGTVQSGILTPSAVVLPGNAELTLAVQGQLPSDTKIRYATLTLQLPLGISVVLDPLSQTPGASVAETAIPVDVAGSANVYPTPVLSSTNNQLGINISSLSGFGTGNILAVRCVVGSAALLGTAANDFSVTSATFYSDIYKNQRLKGLGAVPVALVFPSHEGKLIYTSRCVSCHDLDPADASGNGLYGKAAQIANTFTSTQHSGIPQTISLTATEQGYLSEYLTAVTNGWLVY